MKAMKAEALTADETPRYETPQRIDRTEATANAARLEGRGRAFLNMLRESFGAALRDGLIVRSARDNPGDEVTVAAITHDSGRSHNTEAVVDIVSPENQVTRLAIGTVEPTMAARHTPDTIDKTAWLRVVDPADANKSYDSRTLSAPEQADLMAMTDQVLGRVEQACDRGEVEVFEATG